jgi:hypothetical protein
MWLGREDQDKTWFDGPVASVKGKLSDDLVLMDRSNSEEQVKLRSMNQYSHMMIWSGSNHLWLVGACVASTLEEMEWNVQGKGIFVGHFISLIYGWVEKK